MWYYWFYLHPFKKESSVIIVFNFSYRTKRPFPLLELLLAEKFQLNVSFFSFSNTFTKKTYNSAHLTKTGTKCSEYDLILWYFFII